ncbi:MAG: acyltransferase family protein [Armatimonadota bacterium]
MQLGTRPDSNTSAPSSTTGTKRLPGLDALRGMAALSVVFCHCLHMVQFSSYSPSYASSIHFLHLPFSRVLINASDAVLLFFLHSGYVLALPYIANTQSSYFAFSIKRIFRIYPAHVVVMSVMMLVIVLTVPQSIPAMGEWFNRKCTVVPGWDDFFMQNSLIFLDASTEPKAFNGVIWSLVHEMRISLLFPVLTFIVLRRHVIAQLCLLLIYPLLYALLAHIPLLQQHLLVNDLVRSFGYIHLFLVGIFLAEHRERIAEFWTALRVPWRITIMGLALFGYTTHMLFIQENAFFPADPILLVSLVLLVISAANGERIFMTRPAQWLGKVSYSLYLVHIPLLVLWTRLFYQRIPFWGIWIITIATSLLLSAVLYATVERPLQQLGRRIAARIQRKKSVEKLIVSI